MDRIQCVRYLCTTLLILVINKTNAQKPEIINYSPITSSLESELNILGSGFGSNPNDVVVHFGSVNAEILSATEDLLTVRTPAGASYDNISVTNLISGLSGYSTEPFLPSFSGNTFNENAISDPLNFQSESELYDLTINDFDNDGKIDVITANNNSNLISVFQNTSSVGNVSFTKKNINMNTFTLNINSGDLDGDGKPDVVLSKSGTSGDRIYYLKNISTPGNIAFQTPQYLLVSGNIANKIAIEDLDRDGKPEIIVTNQANTDISIFYNTSSPANINFNTVQTIELIDPENNNLNSSGLAVRDLNGDNFPEIVCSPYLEKNLYIFPNISSPGDLVFNTMIKISVEGNIVDLAIGDLNQDKKADIILTKLQQNSLSVFHNNSSENELNFLPEQNIPVNNRPWGIDLGDINGDGQVDIVVASIDFNSRKLTILENESTEHSIQFTTKFLDTPEITRHLKLGDADNDGKPDMILTSIESFNITILRNKNCFIPEIDPLGPLKICVGASIRLSSIQGKGVTYTWDRDNNPVQSGSDHYYDITEPGVYKVVALSESGNCEKPSNAVIVNQGTGDAPELPEIYNSGPFCQGETIILTTDTINNAEYEWTGPNEFVSTNQNISVPNATGSMAGLYYLKVKVGECTSNEAETIVKVNTMPSLTINNPLSDSICESSVLNLSVGELTDFSYQWYLNDQPISGSTDNSHNVTEPGTYSVELFNNNNGCSIFSLNSETISILQDPEAAFSTSSINCSNTVVEFSNLSTFETGTSVTYTWSFGDGSNNDNRINPDHIYTSAGNYNVNLLITYTNGSCSHQATRNITIFRTPEFRILQEPDNQICKGDTLILYTSAAFNSYEWNTGENSREISISQPGDYFVEVKDQNNCTESDTLIVDMYDNPLVSIDASKKQSVVPGETIQLNASGALNYSWTPGEYLNDSTVANPDAVLFQSETFTVRGFSADGCSDTASLLIEVLEGNEIFVNPRKVFSPNGDGIDDQFVIENLETYPENTIVIYNDLGSKVYEASPYQNNWDAVYKGNNLREGAYYYVITVDGKEPKTGSVTIIR